MIKKALAVGIFAVVLYFVAVKVALFGFHLHYFKHYPGKCERVDGARFGSENLQVTSDGLTFVTSGVFVSLLGGFKEYITTNKVRGRILLYDFKTPTAGAVELKIKTSKSFKENLFRPHGISILEDKVRGEHLLYVINHPEPSPDSIEKFRYMPKTKELVHEKTFKNDMLHITNDLAVTGEDTFYISNCLYFTNTFMHNLEEIFDVPLGSILYYNGTDFIQMQSGLLGPNGLTLSANGRYLYNAVPPMQSIHVYAREKNNTLRLIQEIPLHTAPDNFHLSESGDALYAGNHPVFYKLAKLVHDPNNKSPSQVLHIPLQVKDGRVLADEITEVFYDYGELISASTVAAVYKNKLIIGSLMDCMVVCDISMTS